MDEADRAEVQKMVAEAAQEAEARLVAGMAKAMEPISKKIDLAIDLNKKSKEAFEAVPGLIQAQVESQLTENLKGIVEQVALQFEGKMKEKLGGGDNSGGGGPGLSLGYLLENSDKVIAIMNAWRQPTTEAAMLTQVNMMFKWHRVLSEVEKGGGSSDEVAKTIASIFTTKD